MAADQEQLELSIKDISSYFTSIVDLISANYYVNDDDEEDKTSRKRSRKNGKEKINKKLLSKKAKLLKLDPTKHKSSTELKEEIEKREEEFFDNEENQGKGFLKPLQVNDLPSTSLEELRQKLNMKISSLQGKRKYNSSDPRKENRKKRKHSKKEIELARLRQLNKEGSKSVNAKTEVVATKHSNLPKNENGDIVFSKFDFITGNSKPKKKENMHLLLQKAERKKMKLEKLKKDDKVKAEATKLEEAWSKVQKKAEGEKLKDDPKLIKKALKRREKQKEKSTKNWNERLANIENQKQEKQKLRKQHLKERRDSKKTKQTKKKKKVPGF